jgi:hypothetical protein
LFFSVSSVFSVVSFLGSATQEVERTDQTEAHVTASSGRLTLEKEHGETLEVIDRRAQPEVWYRVTLKTLVGRRLSLICEWIDPNYRVAHRNRYQTKVISRTPWQTHARFRLKPDSAIGMWKVRLILHGRELHSLAFRVRD